MKVTKIGDFDYDFFINASEAKKLKNSSLVGKLWNRSYPYNCLDKEIVLRLATENDGVFCGGAESNLERTEFWIKKFIYERLIKNGRIIGARYDGGGNKLNIFNYEYKGTHSWEDYVKKTKEELKL